MKKVLFLTVLFAAGITCKSFAQFSMSLGPLLGMNYNFYHGAAIDNANVSYNGAGFSVGAQADMKFSPVLGMLITVNAFDALNAKASVTQQNVKNVRAFKLAYLTIDPAMKFSVPGTGLGFFAGPGIGFKLQGKNEQYQIEGGQRTQLQAKTDLMNTLIRVNGQIGMSYDFDLKTMFLTPYFLFDYGFTNVQESIEYNASGIKFGLVLKFSVTN